jgi:tRNA nucleotidyltransferase/poly(A) polymerase
MESLTIHDYGQPELPENVGQTWTTDQLREDFTVESFFAPLVFVRRKSDGQRGTLEFIHHPRVYFGFVERLK